MWATCYDCGAGASFRHDERLPLTLSPINCIAHLAMYHFMEGGQTGPGGLVNDRE